MNKILRINYMTKHNSVYDLPANEYNIKLSKILKEMPEFKQPEWSFFVKTGVAK